MRMLYAMNYETTARSERNTKIGPCATIRALPRLGNMAYGLESGENGHLARANGAIDGPWAMGHRVAHQPGSGGSVCLEGGVSRWLVGVVGLGAELHPRLHTRRVGRFFNSSG
jgi:hypothetical protein